MDLGIAEELGIKELPTSLLKMDLYEEILKASTCAVDIEETEEKNIILDPFGGKMFPLSFWDEMSRLLEARVGMEFHLIYDRQHRMCGEHFIKPSVILNTKDPQTILGKAVLNNAKLVFERRTLKSAIDWNKKTAAIKKFKSMLDDLGGLMSDDQLAIIEQTIQKLTPDSATGR